jgi:hypothetical protein
LRETTQDRKTSVVFTHGLHGAAQVKKDSEMNATTEKTVRNASEWIKITRDNQKRKFTFARGYAGKYQAHEIHSLSFKWVPNWTEALDRANRTLAAYA